MRMRGHRHRARHHLGTRPPTAALAEHCLGEVLEPAQPHRRTQRPGPLPRRQPQPRLHPLPRTRRHRTAHRLRAAGHERFAVCTSGTPPASSTTPGGWSSTNSQTTGPSTTTTAPTGELAAPVSVRSRASSHRLIQLCSNLLHYCPDRLSNNSNALSHGFNDVSPVRQPSSTGPGQHAPPVRRPRTASNDEVPGQTALTGDVQEEMTPTFGNIPRVRKGGFEPPRP